MHMHLIDRVVANLWNLNINLSGPNEFNEPTIFVIELFLTKVKYVIKMTKSKLKNLWALLDDIKIKLNCTFDPIYLE